MRIFALFFALIVSACLSKNDEPMADLGTSDGALDMGHDTFDAADAFDMPDIPMCPFGCDGGRCCPRGLGYACVPASDAGEACPLPDISVSTPRLSAGMSVTWQYFPEDSCALVERCIGGGGWRRLLRFTVFTPNTGTGDLILGAPDGGAPGFEYSACHGHYHFLDYADYSLNNLNGETVGTGHKQAFCALDSEQVDPSPGIGRTVRYTCDDQGLQRGWGDNYYASLDCQWIDVTDVSPGVYVLRVEVNPRHRYQETDYTNNVAAMPIEIPDDARIVPTAPCPAPLGGQERDCGWTPDTMTRTCSPGAHVEVGCGPVCGIGGACVGDPMLRVCEGTTTCGNRTALAHDSDSCGGSCPLTGFICPLSGRYSVLTAPFISSETFSCEVHAR